MAACLQSRTHHSSGSGSKMAQSSSSMGHRGAGHSVGCFSGVAKCVGSREPLKLGSDPVRTTGVSRSKDCKCSRW